MIDRIKQHTLKAAQFIKQLFCIHDDEFVGFDHHMSIMRTRCPKCGASQSYWVGTSPKKIQVKPNVTCHDL